jgi:type VI secretion system protein ImpG
MKQDILSFYNEELSYLNKVTSEFSRKHPRIASNLKLGDKHQNDPLINHLIESFSFISATMRMQLQEDNETLAKMLLQQTHPHYLTALPSASLIKLHNHNGLTEKVTIEKLTKLSITQANSNILFSTVYDTDIHPIEINDISFNKDLKCRVGADTGKKLKSFIDIKFSINEEVDLKNIQISKLRLYINTDRQYVPAVYEHLLNKFSHASILTDGTNEDMLELFKIKPVGLSNDENLVPYTSNSHSSYELLGEYFSFPEKYQFVSFEFNDNYQFTHHQFTLRLYTDEYNHEFENLFDRDTLSLNCTPIINLFNTHAEPINYTTEKHEFLVKINPYVDANFYSIYKINHVTLILDSEKSIEISPYFNQSHSSSADIFWHERRCNANDELLNQNGRQDVYISLVDSEGELLQLSNATLQIEVLATNHNHPTKIITEEADITFWHEDQNDISKIEILKSFSKVQYMNDTKTNLWKLLSHLNHGRVPISSRHGNTEWLEELLCLYNCSHTNERENILNSVESIQCTKIIKRHPSSKILGYCQGTLVTICINEEHLLLNEIYLFISVIAIHLKSCCNLNSFVETKLIDEFDKTLAYWPAQAGNKEWI